MATPDDAQMFSDFATVFIAAGTLGCLVCPPKFVWVGRLPGMEGKESAKKTSFFFMVVLTTGLLFSLWAVRLRLGLAPFLAILVAAFVVLVILAGLHWFGDLSGIRRGRRADGSDAEDAAPGI